MKALKRRVHWDDVVVHGLTTVAAVVTATAVFIIGAFLISAALPAIRFNGQGFFASVIWNPGAQYGSGGTIVRNGISGEAGASLGSLLFVFGTVVSSIFAMLIATPVAVLTAIALVYRVPRRMRTVADTAVELMAGVPSVVYGLWGIVVVVPWIGGIFGPFVTARFGDVPFFGGSSGSGNGLLAAILILAIMILPIMAATMRDMMSVRHDLFEASMALGATSWQTVSGVIVPSVWRGMLGSAMLALGRALGETMAVLMVGGAALNELPQNVFAPINTIAAVIVSQLDSALTDSTGLSIASLAELALVLFAITLAVNLIARYIVRRTAPVKF